MIAASVRMHGFESPSFAALGALAARRNLARPHELHVLHDNGHVLAVVDTATGRLHDAMPDIDDAAAFARHLRLRHGVDRVVVAEVEALRAMLAAVEERVTPAWTQPDVLLAFQHGFRACDGVVSDPPPTGLESWDALKRRLANAGDGAVVLAAHDTAGWPIALLGHLQDGALVEVTDLPPAAVAMLPDLAAVAEVLGSPVVAALVLAYDDLAAALVAADVAHALLDHLTVARRPS